MKRWFLAPALTLAMAALIHADPQSVPDPGKDFPISAQAGPWVVVAATYTGPDSADLTRQLVTWLRSKNYPAYVWNFADKKRAEMKADETRWKQDHPQGPPFKGWEIKDEFSILIGGFQDMDSAHAFMVKVLREPYLREPRAPLPPLKLSGGKSAYDKAVYSVPDGPNGKMKYVSFDISPFANSFVSRNPALGSAKKADPLLKVLNAEEEYSLLKCPAPWTMTVQTFDGGGAMYVPLKEKEVEPSTSPIGNIMDALGRFGGSNKPNGEGLNGAALQAHEMAAVLRKLGFESYVLHTRHSSIVTIGAFNGPSEDAVFRTAQRLADLKLDKLQIHSLTTIEVPRP